MIKIYKTWSQIKALINSRKCCLRYEENDEDFYIWAQDGDREYHTTIFKQSGDPDYAEFLETYKPNADKPHRPISEDGKEIVRAESKPIGHTTVFAGQGDSATQIAAGKVLTWDFSNDDDDITPSGVNYKRKRLEFQFIDPIYVKEGTIYYHNVPKGTYMDFMIVCPNGHYYYDNDGNLHQATEDTIISHYVVRHPMQDSVPMGDELNTETCSAEIPSNYKFWVEITAPDTDTTSNGAVELEIYRKRTVIL